MELNKRVITRLISELSGCLKADFVPDKLVMFETLSCWLRSLILPDM